MTWHGPPSRAGCRELTCKQLRGHKGTERPRNLPVVTQQVWLHTTAHERRVLPPRHAPFSLQMRQLRAGGPLSAPHSGERLLRTHLSRIEARPFQWLPGKAPTHQEPRPPLSRACPPPPTASGGSLRWRRIWGWGRGPRLSRAGQLHLAWLRASPAPDFLSRRRKGWAGTETPTPQTACSPLGAGVGCAVCEAVWGKTLVPALVDNSGR